jgi:hypothetical protein
MQRLLHRHLMRGHLAQRAAIVLLTGLLLILAASLVKGVSSLGA